jgi:hypothetical protein
VYSDELKVAKKKKLEKEKKKKLHVHEKNS